MDSQADSRTLVGWPSHAGHSRSASPRAFGSGSRCEFSGSPEGARYRAPRDRTSHGLLARLHLGHTLLALRPYWLKSHVKGEFLNDVPPDQQAYFQKFLKSLGPSMKAIPFLQVLAGEGNSKARRERRSKPLAVSRATPKRGGSCFIACVRFAIGSRTEDMNFGPDLTKISSQVKPKDLRSHIINSIRLSQQDIAKEYQTSRVLTVQGKVEGLCRSPNQRGVTLRIAGGKIMTIPGRHRRAHHQQSQFDAGGPRVLHRPGRTFGHCGIPSPIERRQVSGEPREIESGEPEHRFGVWLSAFRSLAIVGDSVTMKIPVGPFFPPDIGRGRLMTENTTPANAGTDRRQFLKTGNRHHFGHDGGAVGRGPKGLRRRE